MLDTTGELKPAAHNALPAAQCRSDLLNSLDCLLKFLWLNPRDDDVVDQRLRPVRVLRPLDVQM